MNIITQQIRPKFQLTHQVLRMLPAMVIMFMFYPNMIVFFAVFAVILLLVFLNYKYSNSKLGGVAIYQEVNFVLPDYISIKYSEIKELFLVRGSLQKLFGLGTIRVSSSAAMISTGITICNISNYQAVYDFLEKKKDEQQRN